METFANMTSNNEIRPLVSIVVPVYNVEDYLTECIESLLTQTLAEIEIILVDDGSTERCPSICDDYAKRDARIKGIHKENGGLSDARNAGIAVCTGEYIGFVDSDDTVEPDMYELLYCNARKYKVDISMCRSNHIVSGGIIRKAWSGQVCTYVGKSEIIKFLFSQTGPSISACIKIYKRNKFFARFPVGKTTEDAFVILDLVQRDSRMVVIDTGKYNYRLRDGSITRQKKYHYSMLDCVRAYEHNYRVVCAELPECRDAARRRLAWAWGRIMWQILETSNYQQHYWKVRYLQKKIRQNYCRLLQNPYCSLSDKVIFTLAAISPILYKTVRNMTEKLRR